jgi:hypothetical protein
MADYKTVEEAKVEYRKTAHVSTDEQTGACVYNAWREDLLCCPHTIGM